MGKILHGEETGNGAEFAERKGGKTVKEDGVCVASGSEKN
jgi:hypothetical protein